VRQLHAKDEVRVAGPGRCNQWTITRSENQLRPHFWEAIRAPATCYPLAVTRLGSGPIDLFPTEYFAPGSSLNGTPLASLISRPLPRRDACGTASLAEISAAMPIQSVVIAVRDLNQWKCIAARIPATSFAGANSRSLISFAGESEAALFTCKTGDGGGKIYNNSMEVVCYSYRFFLFTCEILRGWAIDATTTSTQITSLCPRKAMPWSPLPTGSGSCDRNQRRHP
jgi:hypothetical protein